MSTGIKQERKFAKIIGHWKPGEECFTREENIIVGECAILQLVDGNVVRTSPVTGFSCSFQRVWTINTKNSIYRN